MSPAYCPCHPCICAYRWSCIDLLINTIRNYCGHFTHSGQTRSANLGADEGEHIQLYPRAYFGPQCQRCFDPTNCTNSLWHVWLSWVNLHWLLGIKVTLNWVLVVAVLRVERCMFKLQILYCRKTPKTFDTNLSVLLWLVCLVWRQM